MTYKKALQILIAYDTYTHDEVVHAAEYILKNSRTPADTYAAKRALLNYGN